MPLTDLSIPFHINTTSADPLESFFIPVLRESVSYDVAVGYFSSTWIRDAAEGIAALVANNGHSRWVISPSLSKEDWDLLSSSSKKVDKAQHIEQVTINSIYKLQQELESETRIAIAWLIKDGFIEFKIAIPRNRLAGIFHAKLGIFKDSDNNRVAFSGSYNLTAAANTNWETIDIFLGWNPAEEHRVAAKEQEFEAIWNELDPNLEIYRATDPIVQSFVEITKHTYRPYRLFKENSSDNGKKTPWIPSYFLNEQRKLRDHQELAIRNWFGSNGQGIFHMATGSGKTVTALSTAVKLSAAIVKNKQKLFILVTVPYKHLADQWEKEAKAFGFNPIVCYDDYKGWIDVVQSKILDLHLDVEDSAFLITVNATFMKEKMQDILHKIDVNFLFIADEMHNLGGQAIKQLLPVNAKFRLGLSATPDRYMDEEGTKTIRDYFKETLIEYGIKEAIEDGTLTKYFYYPVLIELYESEMQEYRELSNKISRVLAGTSDAEREDSTVLKTLLIKRARIISNAGGKLPKLKELLAARKDSQYNLIYCGDVIDEEGKQVDRVVSLVGSELGMRTRKFTSEEPNEIRGELLTQFGTGEIQTLVAIRCLDEGVDVPRTETAYILASSSNPRQFVQRRGRVLRRAEGKKFAYIYDFITIPPDYKGLDDDALKIERQMMKKEFIRVNEFAASAENAGDALEILRKIKVKLDLTEM
jgi:DNA phosphorothioation system restriction enzyme